MEIINKQEKSSTPTVGRTMAQNLYLGIALVVVGVIWILYNFDVIGYKFFDAFFSWQMLLLVIGGYLLTMKKWVAGVITMGVGLFFVATDLLDLYIPFNKVVLPVVCIAAGLAVIFSRGYYKK